MSTTGRIVPCLIATAWLAGCATPGGIDLPPLDDWQTRQQVLAGMDRWEFRGRIGVSAGEEGFNGKLHWQQKGQNFDATVSGPLGIGTVRIDGRRGQLTLTDKDGQVTRLDDAERDIAARYGWTIPVDSLRYWALGVPDPEIPPTSTVVDEFGRLEAMQQGDWAVTIGQYRDAAGQSMPRRLTAESPDAKVRLVVDDWTFF